jgi:hypothetical protein
MERRRRSTSGLAELPALCSKQSCSRRSSLPVSPISRSPGEPTSLRALRRHQARVRLAPSVSISERASHNESSRADGQGLPGCHRNITVSIRLVPGSSPGRGARLFEGPLFDVALSHFWRESNRRRSCCRWRTLRASTLRISKRTP